MESICYTITENFSSKARSLYIGELNTLVKVVFILTSFHNEVFTGDNKNVTVKPINKQ